jgi:hypothetical protein
LLTKNVPSGGFRLLYAITQCLNEVNQFHCFPSIEYLAALIKRAPSTVWSMLPKLEEIGAIEIEWGSKGSGHPNVYRLPEEFLAFYFGPEKGQTPKPVLGPKKPRQIGVSKPRQTGVFDQLENPDTPPKKPRSTVKKPGHIGVSHFLATDSHKKERGIGGGMYTRKAYATREAPSAARSADDDRESAVINSANTSVDAPLNPAKTTSDDATFSAPDRPVPRADARTETAAQKQPSPERDATELGAPNGARAAFADVRYAWPSDRTDDEGYAAYVAALAAAHGDTEVVLDAIWERLEESGADPPWLSDALRRIEHDLRYGNPEEDEDD